MTGGNEILNDAEVRAHLEKLRIEHERLHALVPDWPCRELRKSRPRRRKVRRGPPKIITTIRLSADVLSAFRATGRGWQTRMDAVLRHVVADEDLVKLLSEVSPDQAGKMDGQR